MIRKGESYIEGLRLIHRKNGVADWTLTAKRADISDKGDQAHLSDITMLFSGKDVNVQAATGVYDITTRNLTVGGRVVATGKSYSVVADGAAFDSTSGSLTSAGSVAVTGKRFQVNGRGLQADDSGQTIRIFHDVTAVFHN